MEALRHSIEWTATAIEALAVALMVVFIILGTVRWLADPAEMTSRGYARYRIVLGKTLLDSNCWSPRTSSAPWPWSRRCPASGRWPCWCWCAPSLAGASRWKSRAAGRGNPNAKPPWKGRHEMDEVISRFLPELIGRIDGPMSLRLFIQPGMALFFAFRDGRRDAREGRAPWGWTVVSDPAQRGALLLDGWKGFARVFAMAVAMDVAYQYIAIGGFRPLQALVMASLLAMAPYVLLRGAFNRLVRARAGGAPTP
jgi:hypothetical protein